MSDTKLKKFAERITKASDPSQSQALIPAATVVLLRDTADGIETLMLRKGIDKLTA